MLGLNRDSDHLSGLSPSASGVYRYRPIAEGVVRDKLMPPLKYSDLENTARKLYS